MPFPWFRRDRTGVAAAQVDASEAMIALAKANSALSAEVFILKERLDTLEAAQERLRGRVYGLRMHQNPEPEDKHARLRRAFTPGQPVFHKQE